MPTIPRLLLQSTEKTGTGADASSSTSARVSGEGMNSSRMEADAVLNTGNESVAGAEQDPLEKRRRRKRTAVSSYGKRSK